MWSGWNKLCQFIKNQTRVGLKILAFDNINTQMTALFLFKYFRNLLPIIFNDYPKLNKELNSFSQHKIIIKNSQILYTHQLQ